MKVIFLDIDGVLNTDKDRSRFGIDYLDNSCLLQLKRIVQATNARIVLSSSWRKVFRDKNLIKDAFNSFDIPWNIDDCTPIHPGSDIITRASEICQWILHNPFIDKAVILDDFEIIITDPNDSMFLTDDDNGGLTPDIADKVIAYLKD